jgi:hypothetical protein
MKTKKITIIYSLQCPWNIHFIEEIKSWISKVQTEIEEINLFQNYEYARKFLNATRLGYDQHTFIAVFVDEKLVPGHPSSDNFKARFMEALKSW